MAKTSRRRVTPADYDPMRPPAPPQPLDGESPDEYEARLMAFRAGPLADWIDAMKADRTPVGAGDITRAGAGAEDAVARWRTNYLNDGKVSRRALPRPDIEPADARKPGDGRRGRGANVYWYPHTIWQWLRWTGRADPDYVVRRATPTGRPPANRGDAEGRQLARATASRP